MSSSDLWDERFYEVKGELDLAGGTLSVDNSVEDKPYRGPSKSALVDYFYSDKHKQPVKGLNLITLYYSAPSGQSYPVNFRLYDKAAGKTKNDYFREMVLEVQAWGLKPSWVTGDSWYSSLENLKFLRNEKVGFLFGVANNRRVSVDRGTLVQIGTLEIPPEVLMVYLKAFGWVKVFCAPFKNEQRYYILYRPDLEAFKQLSRETFKQVHSEHWQIECFHRVIKQVCNIERFYVRDEQAIRHHVFCALRAFCKLQTMCIKGIINNCYEISRQLFVPVIRQFMLDHVTEPTFS